MCLMQILFEPNMVPKRNSLLPLARLGIKFLPLERESNP